MRFIDMRPGDMLLFKRLSDSIKFGEYYNLRHPPGWWTVLSMVEIDDVNTAMTWLVCGEDDVIKTRYYDRTLGLVDNCHIVVRDGERIFG
jgi:hypothetical protein